MAADLDDFTQKLRTLMSDRDLRIEFGKNAAADMVDYAPEKVIEMWRKLIVETVEERR